MSKTATERLRELLDERGVEWEDDTPVPSMKPWKTSFTSFTGEEVSIGCYDEPKWIMGTLVFHTPEQAIEATLGGGDMRDEAFDERAYELLRAARDIFEQQHDCGYLDAIACTAKYDGTDCDAICLCMDITACLLKHDEKE